uniref:Putative secreted protein n=1 Tax=Panstrongylus lignarius TaxID=156445 RepID=A0A224Y0F1_9HEMI
MHTTSTIILLLIGYATANTILCKSTSDIIISKGDGCISRCSCTDGKIICTEECAFKEVVQSALDEQPGSSLCKRNGAKIVPLGDECNNVCFCSNGEIKLCTSFICKSAGHYSNKREISAIN